MAQSVGEILQQLAELDVFFYVLPFLLIFALVFAILQKVKIMGGGENSNKGVSAVIAITVALMSLQFDQVPIFFQIVFPKLGIALSILLFSIILLGLFLDFSRYTGPIYIFMAIGGGLAIWILLSSIQDYTWWTGSFWADNLGIIIGLGVVIALISTVIATSGSSGSSRKKGFFVPIGDSAYTS